VNGNVKLGRAANGPNIFQMLLVTLKAIITDRKRNKAKSAGQNENYSIIHTTSTWSRPEIL